MRILDSRTYLLDGLSVFAHSPRSFLSEPLRLGIVEAVLELPAITAFNIECLADHVLSTFDPNYDLSRSTIESDRTS